MFGGGRNRRSQIAELFVASSSHLPAISSSQLLHSSHLPAISSSQHFKPSGFSGSALHAIGNPFVAIGNPFVTASAATTIASSHSDFMDILTPCFYFSGCPAPTTSPPYSVNRLFVDANRDTNLIEMEDVNNANRDDDDDDDDCVEIDDVGAGQLKKTGKRKREKKQTSPVWNVFELLKTKDANGVQVDVVINGKRRAKCKWCGEIKNYDSATGNGNLMRHISKCYRENTPDIGQMLLGKDKDSLKLKSSKLNPDIFREKLVRAIVMHNLPLCFVDYIGIKDLFAYVSEELNLLSRNTVRADIVNMHSRETIEMHYISVPPLLIWGLILAIAVVFDPRYKIQTVEWGYKKIYGENSSQFEEVKSTLASLFDIYHANSLTRKNDGSTSKDVNDPKESADGIGSGVHTNEAWEEFDSFDYEYGISTKKSELELYLEEPRMPRLIELNILDYWRGQQTRYPDLTAMARDILTIPVSTVASESAFSVGAKVIDKYRTALKSDITEAIICTKDWIFGDANYNGDDAVNEIVELETDKEGPSSVKSSTSFVDTN
ncbi:hypothetical protein LXL04_000470 [Taraxacum kok-saghyz]